MKSKKNKFKVYLLAVLVPMVIFFLAATLGHRIPIFNEIFQVFDARHQYPGFYMELINRIKDGTLFYSFNGGLGFNFFGTFTYYLCSPLNLLLFFFNAKTLTIFFAITIYLRVGLSGLTMAIYLNNQEKKKDIWVIAFSTIFALMGFLSMYYYNFMWIDSIIMLPLIMLGIDKIFTTNKPYMYIITLALGIVFNYYIGIMLCIYSVIYFIYKLFSFENYNLKKVIIKFICSSLCVGGLVTVILLPTFYSLMSGKATVYGSEWIDYAEITQNALGFFYQLLPATFKTGDQSYGPAVVYSSLFAYVLVIFFFFNKKIKKKEKITVAAILLFFYLSFSISGLDYAWQLFQKPIWWQSRYSFTFSTFMIIIGFKSFMNIDNVKIDKYAKIIIGIIFLGITIISALYVFNNYEGTLLKSSYIFLIFAIFLFIQALFLIEEKGIEWYFLILIFLELSLNTYNGLSVTRYNNTYKYIYDNVSFNEKPIEYIKEKDKSFYRMEITNLNTNNDGMLHNYKGINFFNSNRNQRAMDFLKNKLGVTVDSGCGVKLKTLNPALLSLLNIKYLIGNLDYFENVYENERKSVYENKYPLSIGFMIPSNYKDAKLGNNEIYANYERLYSVFSGEKVELFYYPEFKQMITSLENVEVVVENGFDIYKIMDNNKVGFINIEYKVETDALLLQHNKFSNASEILINDEKYYVGDNSFVYVKKDDILKIKFSVSSDKDASEYSFSNFNIEAYENASKEISANLLEVNNNSKHLVEGIVTSTKDKNIMFTSIPYEEGFTIKVDGKEVKPIIIFDTFLGLELSEGEHTITIDYISKGFIPGLIVSSTTLCGLIIYYIFKRKEKEVK